MQQANAALIVSNMVINPRHIKFCKMIQNQVTIYMLGEKDSIIDFNCKDTEEALVVFNKVTNCIENTLT